MRNRNSIQSLFHATVGAAGVVLLLFTSATAFAADGPGRFSQVHAASTIRESRLLLNDLLISLREPSDLRRTHATIAELAELSGDFQDAQRHYRLAFDAHDQDSGSPLLLRSAHLRFELGDLGGAREEADRVAAMSSPADTAIKARLLGVRIDIAEGDSSSAMRRLQSVAISAAGPPSVLFEVHDLARQLGNGDLASRSQQLLATHHANSVEYALIRVDRGAADRRIERMPTPAHMLVSIPYGTLPEISPGSPAPTRTASTPSTTPAGPRTPAPSATPSADAQLAVGIQAGSFRDAENAAFMARDIRSAGFPAEVRERGGENGAMFVVVVPVPSGTTREAAIRTQIGMKDAGFEGFLLFQ